ncbi:translation initiation factor IF-2-like isoform X2 [Cygnus olor]|uniref:translation initiation factor IF-2-like isoform X2 n=1 Tax=Cygnus olor TaxID=8869 RepID=UPI001ADE5655|nr:translation initiation factor IF-2-like isoform X2 [Cygnus olor]XP_040390909.1 translation initiation factor IF-2-like isoform X2 [Cygnus olor]
MVLGVDVGLSRQRARAAWSQAVLGACGPVPSRQGRVLHRGNGGVSLGGKRAPRLPHVPMNSPLPSPGMGQESLSPGTARSPCARWGEQGALGFFPHHLTSCYAPKMEPLGCSLSPAALAEVPPAPFSPRGAPRAAQAPAPRCPATKPRARSPAPSRAGSLRAAPEPFRPQSVVRQGREFGDDPGSTLGSDPRIQSPARRDREPHGKQPSGGVFVPGKRAFCGREHPDLGIDLSTRPETPSRSSGWAELAEVNHPPRQGGWDFGRVWVLPCPGPCWMRRFPPEKGARAALPGGQKMCSGPKAGCLSAPDELSAKTSRGSRKTSKSRAVCWPPGDGEREAAGEAILANHGGRAFLNDSSYPSFGSSLTNTRP